MARDNKICVSALRYMSARPGAKLALPEPACHETTYCSGFHLFGFLAYAVPLCGRFFGFDDDGDAANVILTAVGHNLRRVLAWLKLWLRLFLHALCCVLAFAPLVKTGFLTDD